MIKKYFLSISLSTVALILMGIFFGTSTYTFYYGEGHSYFVDDPKACLNCHAMKEQFDDWNKSTHRNVATCNTCHSPQGFVAQYVAKGINGFAHSYAFTFNNYKDPIQIKKWNKDIALNACLNCHQITHGQDLKEDNYNCTTCHKDVGH